MDKQFELQEINFVWDSQKSKANSVKHSVSFEQAAEVFFDPFFKIIDASRKPQLGKA